MSERDEATANLRALLDKAFAGEAYASIARDAHADLRANGAVITPTILKRAIEERLAAYDKDALVQLEVEVALRTDGSMEATIRQKLIANAVMRQVPE